MDGSVYVFVWGVHCDMANVLRHLGRNSLRVFIRLQDLVHARLSSLAFLLKSVSALQSTWPWEHCQYRPAKGDKEAVREGPAAMLCHNIGMPTPPLVSDVHQRNQLHFLTGHVWVVILIAFSPKRRHS